MKKCTNLTCSSKRKIYCKGLCSTCYLRLLKHGDPNIVLKRGPKKNGNGKQKYEYIWDPIIKQNILAHRKIMADHLGRALTNQETVHHKNGNSKDNRIENLELWSKSQPAGQRVSDKIQWAIEILTQYKPETLSAVYAAKEDSN